MASLDTTVPQDVRCNCQFCLQELQFRIEDAGQVVNCPACHRRIRVPSPLNRQIIGTNHFETSHPTLKSAGRFPVAFFRYFTNKWKEWKENKELLRKQGERAQAVILWNAYHETTTMREVSAMTGIQFEGFLARLLLLMGYTEIRLTPANDQGGDIVCISPEGVPVVVQAKRWKGTVGNQAVNELFGAMRYYKCNKGLVVTNSTFTRAAVELAGTGSDVTLCDGEWLGEQVQKFVPPEVPEFNQTRFDEIVRELSESTRPDRTPETGHNYRRRNARKNDYTFIGMLTGSAAAKGRELNAKDIMRVAEHYDRISKASAELKRIQSQIAEMRGNPQRSQ